MAAIIGTYWKTKNDGSKNGKTFCIVLPSVEHAEIGKQFILDAQKASRASLFEGPNELRTVISEFSKKVGEEKEVYAGISKLVGKLVLTFDDGRSVDASVVKQTDGLFIMK